MKTCNYSSLSAYSLEGRPDAVLLNRLGSELARVYRDTLEASLPPGLQELARRLEVESGRRDGPDRPQATHLS